MARQCLIAAIQHKPEVDTPVSLFNGPADEVKCEDLERVVIGDDPERFFQIGAQIPLLEKEQLVDLLRRNVDVFAWDAYETPGLDPKFICHHLNVNPSITLKRQPHWRPSREHVEAVKSKVTKLKQAGAIKEVFYPQWLTKDRKSVV